MIVHTLMMCTGDAGPEQNLFLFIFKQPKRYNLCPCQNVCDALHYLLDTIFIRFGSKIVYIMQIVGMPNGYKLCSSCCRFVIFFLL